MWPDVACNSAWLQNRTAVEERESTGEPRAWLAEDWRYDIEVIPRRPLQGPPSTHRCLAWYYYEETCDTEVSTLS